MNLMKIARGATLLFGGIAFGMCGLVIELPAHNFRGLAFALLLAVAGIVFGARMMHQGKWENPDGDKCPRCGGTGTVYEYVTPYRRIGQPCPLCTPRVFHKG